MKLIEWILFKLCHMAKSLGNTVRIEPTSNSLVALPWEVHQSSQ